MTTAFLVLSDTHDNAFPDPLTLPKVDVVLHSGDLTMIGGLSNYKKAIANLKALDAELKLVIAGNHDVSLDPKWWTANLIEEDDDDSKELAKALALFEAERPNGLHLLNEGTHTFTLSGNRRFTIYASPYTPEFNGYAFAYLPGEDRFSPGAENPIPSSGVDIVMTYGPPLPPLRRSETYGLDINRDGEHCGCLMLFEAVRRAGPKMHCFGHLHEGYGVQEVVWGHGHDGAGSVEADTLGPISRQTGTLVWEEGRTIMVNAAVMNYSEGEENNKPWVVNLDLGST